MEGRFMCLTILPTICRRSGDMTSPTMSWKAWCLHVSGNEFLVNRSYGSCEGLRRDVRFTGF